MSKIKTALIINIVIVIFEIFAVAWMICGWEIVPTAIFITGLGALNFFTIDSNILMGIIAIIAAVEEIQIIKGKKKEIPTAVYVLKYVGTVGVALTMLVVVFFLTPVMSSTIGWFGCYEGAHFFLHLALPILAIISFVVFEKTDRITFPMTFYGLVPPVIYGMFYVVLALTHVENGKIMSGYDWYSFLSGGISTVYYIVPILLISIYIICFVLWKCNSKRS